MAHFAYVIDGVVQKVHLVANDVITDSEGVEQEELGQQFLASLHGYDAEQLFQCSYNGNLRGNYPGVGFTYHSQLDAFISPKPFDSWILDEETFQWEAPVPYPSEGDWEWDEDAGDWVAVPEAPEV